MKILIVLFCCVQSGILMAQDFSVSGKVTNAANLPLSFVNVLVYEDESQGPLKGTTTDEGGVFILNGLAAGSYQFRFSYIGFENFQKNIEISANVTLNTVVLQENQQILDETVVIAKLPTIHKSSGKLVFTVENTSFSVGSTMDLLKKTPGVVVIGESIQIKFSTPLIYINGKRVYLSQAEVVSLLENTDAANIKSIEVITNPSAKYDAEAGTVLNIVTSKAISIGYKGAVNATYEQGTFPKYKFGTSHFYKNNWLNVYASYTIGKGKNYKEDESFIRYFQPDEVSTKSIWETSFNRTTTDENHSGIAVLDFSLDENNSISLSSNISLSPKVDYFNNGKSSIYNAQRQLDSIMNTYSEVGYRKNNLNFAVDYNRNLNTKGATLSASANYIYYDHAQNQSVISDYLLANGDFIKNRSFYTDSKQNSEIFTAQADVSTALWGGTFETGIKFSNVNTESMLSLFNTENNTNVYNSALSDIFNYKENIYAEYINFEKEWENWSFTVGLRGEFTAIDAISRSLGQLNSQSYFDVFPSASIHHILNENNGIGLSYSRNVSRPRYQSLNPFKYFITELNFNSGNPNLVPAIEDKITFTIDHKNKLFFEFYYQNVEKSLDILTFQDNDSNKLERIDANLTKSYQYAFDITYFSSLNSWWWMHFETSTFYLANEFLALQSSQESYTNDTFGQYLFLNNHFTLSKDRSFTADLTGRYISNFVFGNRYFKNQNFVNISVRKEFWDKRASLSIGVDDIFDSLNKLASVAKYYNQDNWFVARQESRVLRLGLTYNFGNARLRDNKKNIKTDEGDRLREN